MRPTRHSVRLLFVYGGFHGWVTESYSAGQHQSLPCSLHVLEDAQIRLQIIPCGGLDVGMAELSCDHADVGARLDCQRAERVTQIAWRDRG